MVEVVEKYFKYTVSVFTGDAVIDGNAYCFAADGKLLTCRTQEQNPYFGEASNEVLHKNGVSTLLP